MRTIYLIFISMLLLGCEKYDDISEPSVAGRWKFTDYYITPVKNYSGLLINSSSDTICVNSFSRQSLVNGNIHLKQDYKNTSPDRRFVKNVTMWEFDGSSQSTYFPLLINHKNVNTWAIFPKPYMEKEYVDLVINNEEYGVNTEYMFIASGMGQNYSKKLTLTSPVISTDLYYSNGGRDKSMDVVITLIFTRN